MASFRHILAAVDLSQRSRQTVAQATAVARACRARLTVLHVSRARLDEEGRAEMLAQLSGLLPPFEAELRAHVDVVPGRPVPELLAFAAAQEVDLIVVGGGARGVVARAFLESVGERLTQGARCAVMAVGGPKAQAPTISRILCAVDLNETSRSTVEIAASLAADTGAKLTLLHVIEPWRWTEAAPMASDKASEVCREMERAAKERVSSLLSRHVLPALSTRIVVSFGMPTTQILREARAADLLVVGAQSKRVLGLNLLGATAQAALDDAPCPVLLARSQARARKPLALTCEDELVTV
jgi:universal stress protein A